MRFSCQFVLSLLLLILCESSLCFAQRDCRNAQDGQLNCTFENIINAASPNLPNVFGGGPQALPSKTCVLDAAADPCRFSGTVCNQLVTSKVSGYVECVGGNDLSTVYDPAHENSLLQSYTHNTQAGIQAIDADQGIYAVANKDFNNSSYKPIYSVADSKNHMLIDSAVMGCGSIEKNEDQLVCNQVKTYTNSDPKTFSISMDDVRAFPQKNFPMDVLAKHVSVDLCALTERQHLKTSFLDHLKTPSTSFQLSRTQSLKIYSIKDTPFSHCNVTINGKEMNCTGLYVSEKGIDCKYSVQSSVSIENKPPLSDEDFAQMLSKSVFRGKSSLSGTEINQSAGDLLRVDDPKSLIEEGGFTSSSFSKSPSSRSPAGNR